MAGGVSLEKEGKRTRTAKVLAQVLGKYKYVLLVIAAGVICLAWPSAREAVTPEAEISETGSGDGLDSLQQEMEEILGKISGVGQVQVMLTLDRGSESVLAEDTTLSYSGQTQAPDDYNRSSETVVLSKSGSGDNVVVTQEVYPQFRGALVVSEGGGDPAVQLTVTAAVSALTGLGSDRISVLEWQS